ncbi:MAG: diacylglycerol kinase family protein [Geminicoccaceae bacterium]
MAAIDQTLDTDAKPATDRPAPVARRFRVLINRGGGTMLAQGVDTVRDKLQSVFDAAGIDADLHFVAGAELRPMAEAAREDARAGRLDAVVVGGGDGSVSTVAGVMADSGVTMGVLPVGTLNHFAGDVGMPADIEAAARALTTAEIRSVDVGEVNGRIFINNSVIGAYPYMVIDRERRREMHGLGKWPAMALAFGRLLWRFPRRRLTLCLEGQAKPYRTPLLFIGVNEYSFDYLKPHRAGTMDAGELWLLVARVQGPIGLVRLVTRAAFIGLDGARDFNVMKVRGLEIRLRASRVPVAFDGEVEIMQGPLKVRIRPGALRVLAPPATPG